MAWSKVLTRTVATPRGVPVDAATRWCLAESVWRFAGDNGLAVESFRQVDPRRDVPVSAGRTLGVRPDEFDWHVFEAVVSRA